MPCVASATSAEPRPWPRANSQRADCAEPSPFALTGATASARWAQAPIMHHRLFLHVVWTTRDRAPTIDARRAEYLGENLPIVARQERGHVLALGIVTTHLHLLLRVHPTTQIPRLLQRMKGGTAHGVNRGIPPGPRQLRWARGYSVTSVHPKALEAVREYVLSQNVRHPGEVVVGWGGRGIERGRVELAAKAAARLMSLKRRCAKDAASL